MTIVDGASSTDRARNAVHEYGLAKAAQILDVGVIDGYGPVGTGGPLRGWLDLDNVDEVAGPGNPRSETPEPHGPDAEVGKQARRRRNP